MAPSPSPPPPSADPSARTTQNKFSEAHVINSRESSVLDMAEGHKKTFQGMVRPQAGKTTDYALRARQILRFLQSESRGLEEHRERARKTLEALDPGRAFTTMLAASSTETADEEKWLHSWEANGGCLTGYLNRNLENWIGKLGNNSNNNNNNNEHVANDTPVGVDNKTRTAKEKMPAAAQDDIEEAPPQEAGIDRDEVPPVERQAAGGEEMPTTREDVITRLKPLRREDEEEKEEDGEVSGIGLLVRKLKAMAAIDSGPADGPGEGAQPLKVPGGARDTHSRDYAFPGAFGISEEESSSMGDASTSAGAENTAHTTTTTFRRAAPDPADFPNFTLFAIEAAAARGDPEGMIRARKAMPPSDRVDPDWYAWYRVWKGRRR